MSEDESRRSDAHAPVVPAALLPWQKKPRFSWTPAYETTFFQSLCRSVQLGLRENMSFKAEAWNRALADLHEQGAFPTKAHLINKTDNARKKFRMWRGLIENPQFTYSPTTRTVSASEEAWQAHLEKEPLARGFRDRPFDNAEFLEVLFPDVVGSGGQPKRVTRPRKKGADGTTPDPSVLQLHNGAVGSPGVPGLTPSISATPIPIPMGAPPSSRQQGGGGGGGGGAGPSALPSAAAVAGSAGAQARPTPQGAAASSLGGGPVPTSSSAIQPPLPPGATMRSSFGGPGGRNTAAAAAAGASSSVLALTPPDDTNHATAGQGQGQKRFAGAGDAQASGAPAAAASASKRRRTEGGVVPSSSNSSGSSGGGRNRRETQQGAGTAGTLAVPPPPTAAASSRTAGGDGRAAGGGWANARVDGVAGLLLSDVLSKYAAAAAAASTTRWPEQAMDLFFEEFGDEDLDLQLRIAEKILTDTSKAVMFCKMPATLRRHWVKRLREAISRQGN